MNSAPESDLQTQLTRERHRVHLIGVAGSGMSGIAALLLELGHQVSGSDRVGTLETERLQRLGLRFHVQHRAEDAADAEIVVYSSAIKEENPILAAARAAGKQTVRRAEALAAMMRGKRGIVVAGMHGKTTTSAMLSHVFREGGLHPSHYVGAEIPILGTNAHWNPRGQYFVAEGDESDGTLRFFHPEHALILNIEEEHLDFYADMAAIEAVFSQLLEQTTGHVFYCADDANAVRLCGSPVARESGDRSVAPPAISYGFSPAADYRGVDLELRDFASVFCVYRRGEKLGEAVLNVPGRHNVSNALGVVAVATEVGIPFEKVVSALGHFQHARRRFEIKYASERFLLVDDYAHHPTEIRATLATARSTGRNRVLAMFQPHRYSRTQALKKEFGSAFDAADHVFVSDVYPASEAPIPGVNGNTVVEEILAHGHGNASYQPRLHRLHCDVGNQLAPGDVVLSLGAGNIHEQLSILAADLVIAEKLKEIVGREGDVRLYEPLAKHTTLRVGGPAQFWVEPRDEAAFAEIIRLARHENLPLFVIGRGSNLLVRDGGIRGIVVHPAGGEFDRVDFVDGEIVAGVGAKLKQVAYAGKAAGIGELEWMEGIPGEVGGALRMNAGAMGWQTFDNVARIRYLDPQGEPHEKTPAELDVRYRSVPLLKTNYAVSAVFRGKPSSTDEIMRKLNESQEKRRTTQPAAKSAGCIFKNPGSCPAGKLVDELGLKNSSVGDARISEVHGNFLVNDGQATATDIIALIEKVKDAARQKRGIELETEVQIIGEPA
ncbi:MAG: UDP-N-acetylmuramate--L-alanine ligase [Verrucomicrobiota bacterium]|nr:UDP-N-acetylmuramate--L-alanine ligase [Verrucomicrobiota bacterium]